MRVRDDWKIGISKVCCTAKAKILRRHLAQRDEAGSHRGDYPMPSFDL